MDHPTSSVVERHIRQKLPDLHNAETNVPQSDSYLEVDLVQEEQDQRQNSKIFDLLHVSRSHVQLGDHAAAGKENFRNPSL